MEIDPLLTVVQEMGRLVGHETPTVDTVLALIKLREQIAQQKDGAPAAKPEHAAPSAKAA
jgi:2-dehydropantoate 2-reductase